MTQEKKEISFEAGFARLEEILAKMNTGDLSLEDSLRLYEEADKLILACTTRLTEAEQKVELLIKNRSGDLLLGEDQKPQTEEFSPAGSI